MPTKFYHMINRNKVLTVYHIRLDLDSITVFIVTV